MATNKQFYSFLENHSLYDLRTFAFVIENGISSENSDIRTISFQMIQEIYTMRDQILYWSEVRQALFIEIGEAEASNSLQAALHLIEALPNYQFLQLFLVTNENDCLNAIKNCCNSKDIYIRSSSVGIIGNILLRLWILLNGKLNHEGYQRFESLIDVNKYVTYPF
jgi:hypothetical protein